MAPSDCDVLIIGAGAGGAAAAWRLVQHGFSVTCLERGNWVDPKASPASDPDWEVIRQRSWNPNPNRRRGVVDDPVDDTDSEIKPLYFNGVGAVRFCGPAISRGFILRISARSRWMDQVMTGLSAMTIWSPTMISTSR